MFLGMLLDFELAAIAGLFVLGVFFVMLFQLDPSRKFMIGAGAISATMVGVTLVAQQVRSYQYNGYAACNARNLPQKECQRRYFPKVAADELPSKD